MSKTSEAIVLFREMKGAVVARRSEGAEFPGIG